MANSFKVGDVSVERGEFKMGSLGSFELPDGTPTKIPVLVAHGAKEGPVFYFQGASDGGELIGAEVVRRVLREEVSPKNLSGTIIGVPVANPFGFQWARRNSPIDEQHLGSSFPGAETGVTSTEMVAHAIWEAAQMADYVIDIHGNYPPCTAFTLLNLNLNNKKAVEGAQRMAEALGLTIVYAPGMGTTVGMSSGLKTLSGLTAEKGSSPIAIELIDARRVTQLSSDIGTKGVLNVLKTLGMIEGKVEPQPKQVLWGPGRVQNAGWLTARKGGIPHFLVDPGTLVRANETIARIYDLYGDVAEEIKLPFDGYVRAFTYRFHQALATGDAIAYVTRDK